MLAGGHQRLLRLLRIQRFSGRAATHHEFGALADHRLEQAFLGSEVAVDRHL
jgi:hypothetical protein